MAFKRPSVATTLVLILMTATVVDAVAQANKLKEASDNPLLNSPQLRVIIPRSLGENGTDESDEDHPGCHNTTGCDHMDDYHGCHNVTDMMGCHHVDDNQGSNYTDTDGDEEHHGCHNFTNMMGCDHVDDNHGSNDTDTDGDEEHHSEDGPPPGGPGNLNLTGTTSDLLAAYSGVSLPGSGLVPALSMCVAYFILC